MAVDQTTKNQVDIVALQTSLNAHLQSCEKGQARTERLLSDLFDRLTKLERVLWIGLGVLAALLFMVPMIKLFVASQGGS